MPVALKLEMREVVVTHLNAIGSVVCFRLSDLSICTNATHKTHSKHLLAGWGKLGTTTTTTAGTTERTAGRRTGREQRTGLEGCSDRNLKCDRILGHAMTDGRAAYTLANPHTHIHTHTETIVVRTKPFSHWGDTRFALHRSSARQTDGPESDKPSARVRTPSARRPRKRARSNTLKHTHTHAHTSGFVVVACVSSRV